MVIFDYLFFDEIAREQRFCGSKFPPSQSRENQEAVADIGPLLAGEKQRENGWDEVSNKDHVSHLKVWRGLERNKYLLVN